ncbi:hypothetical protein C6503_17345 [Candidatus Poribacteria bacterium]|nr:MAG: hypothetical protein C6503_17345 [Candidatus Poribacteria bacterium]
MRAKRTSSAFMTSLVLHAVAAFLVGVYLITQTSQFQEFIGAEILVPIKPKKPTVRNPIIKKDFKPIVPTQSTVTVEPVEVKPRVTTVFNDKQSYQPQTVLEFSNQTVKVKAPVNPNVPKVVTPNAPAPTVVTRADVPVSDAPNALAFSAPVATAPSAGPANIGRGTVGSSVQVKIAFERSPGLAMVQHVGAVNSNIDDVDRKINLGFNEVPPAPKGEPHGHVIGRGKDIRGVFRFSRIRHSLSDWWADASALNALTHWLNERTKIKTDMNVSGGAMKLTDANLQKSPLVFMTGHDPALVLSRNLLGRQYGGGKMDGRLSDAEAAGLRRYLVEKGGLLVFDDCGVNAPAQAMIRLFLAQMRFVMPEYHVQRIPNDHEIYSNFYEMGGPPVGFDIFWWGTRPPKRNYLESISVGDKLSVIVVRRDYMCAMESVSLPTRNVHYSPGVYRFMTNVVVYALTHGQISDYSGYVPEDVLAKTELPTRAPQAARVGSFE